MGHSLEYKGPGVPLFLWLRPMVSRVIARLDLTMPAVLAVCFTRCYTAVGFDLNNFQTHTTFMNSMLIEFASGTPQRSVYKRCL